MTQRPILDDVDLYQRRPLPPPMARLATHPPAPSATKRGGFGTISPGTAGTLAYVVLMVGAWLLFGLGIIGAALAWRGLDAPLTDPVALVALFLSDTRIALLATITQIVLSFIQWGARPRAKHEPRWWLAYLASLAVSVAWNWDAYGQPLIALGAPWALAFGIILLADVLAEIGIVR